MVRSSGEDAAEADPLSAIQKRKGVVRLTDYEILDIVGSIVSIVLLALSMAAQWAALLMKHNNKKK